MRRRGIETPFGKQLPKVLNGFFSDSSRVVRAMLQEPLRGWQLNEMAAHYDVRVCPGLMSGIKRSLVAGGYKPSLADVAKKVHGITQAGIGNGGAVSLFKLLIAVAGFCRATKRRYLRSLIEVQERTRTDEVRGLG